MVIAVIMKKGCFLILFHALEIEYRKSGNMKINDRVFAPNLINMEGSKPVVWRYVMILMQKMKYISHIKLLFIRFFCKIGICWKYIIFYFM